MAAGSSPNVVALAMSPCCKRTQCPSLRSMAGIRSMVGQARGTGATPTRAGIPVQEVSIEGEALVRAFLGMELGGENIIAGDGGGKARAVLGFPDAVALIRRPRVVTVHEVEEAAIRHARPEGMRLRLDHAVPTHLRHLVAAAVGLQLAGQLGLDDLAVNGAPAGGRGVV